MQKKIMPGLLAAALLLSGLVSILFLRGQQANVRLLRQVDLAREAVRRIVGQQAAGREDAGPEEIFTELTAGGAGGGLRELLDQMRAQWTKIEDEARLVRQGKAEPELRRLGEEFFGLADRTADAAAADSARLGNWEIIAVGVVVLLLAALLIWYGAARSRRRAKEAAAGDRHGAENPLAEDLRTPVDEISELLYVSDMENYELLFINEAGRKSFGVPELRGQKCYRVLQGQEGPCEFCTTPFLVPGQNYTWERTNSVTGRHYLLKDRLIEWNGRPARMEIAFDMTEAEAEKQALKLTLDAEEMVMECVRVLYREHDVEHSIPAVLERLGRFLSADRTYLGMVREERLYNDYEWCAEGVESQKEMLQDLPLSTVGSWLPIFARQECVILEDLELLRENHPEEYELLHSQNIQSLAAAPLEQDGKFRGLLGVDNPPPGRIRGIASLLQTLCYFLMLACRRGENERQLFQLSYYDTLTSFYNRNRYIEDAAAFSGHGGPIGVVYLDVNGLKDINDRRGHAFGDKMLMECTRQMREVFRDAHYYRIGGDEFVILCPGIDHAVFEDRVSRLRSCFGTNGLCHVAVGARWAVGVKDVRQLITRADAQMYEDKKEFYRRNPASNRYRHHSDEVLALSDPEVLREELRRERFVVCLQPKIFVADRSPAGAEALVRYQPRSGSPVPPIQFLSLLEETRTIGLLDFYVFENVCSRLREWLRLGREPFPLTVNFSRSSLAQPDFLSRLAGRCLDCGVESKYLEIGFTGTAREADEVNFHELTHELRQQGFRVAFDGFGTEHVDLSLLSQAEFDSLKLNRSLVNGLDKNARGRTVVESIAELCRKLQIQMVAEGVETEEQLAVLRSCGVELAQGGLFGPPVPAGEYERQYM